MDNSKHDYHGGTVPSLKPIIDDLKESRLKPNRLLSEQEQQNIRLSGSTWKETIKETAIAQDLKSCAARDKEWADREMKMMERINELLPKLQKYDTIGSVSVNGIIEEIFICDDDGEEVPETRKCLKDMGQERKKEIGIK